MQQLPWTFPLPLCLTFLSSPLPELQLEVREGAEWEGKGHLEPPRWALESRGQGGPRKTRWGLLGLSSRSFSLPICRTAHLQWALSAPQPPLHLLVALSASLCSPFSPAHPLTLWVSFTHPFCLYPFCLSHFCGSLAFVLPGAAVLHNSRGHPFHRCSLSLGLFLTSSHWLVCLSCPLSY